MALESATHTVPNASPIEPKVVVARDSSSRAVESAA
jgi:hypothetical protein